MPKWPIGHVLKAVLVFPTTATEGGLSEITVTPLVLPSLDKGIYGANMYNFDT
jgi:hypothetical protein